MPKKSNDSVGISKGRYSRTESWGKDVDVRRVVASEVSRWTIRKWREKIHEDDEEVRGGIETANERGGMAGAKVRRFHRVSMCSPSATNVPGKGGGASRVRAAFELGRHA